MEYCIVKLNSQTASFRNPEFFNYHKSFLVPPPTTLIGMAGAALGLSPKAAQAFFDEDIFEMGAYALTEGVANDLWKYNDFALGSVIQREIMFKNKFIIIFGTENREKIKQLEEAFNYPMYCLTMGSSDSLAMIEGVFTTTEINHSYTVSHCLLEGNIVEEVINSAQNGLEFSIYSTSDPIAYQLPVQFHYTKDYGMRKVNKRKEFSFIGEEMVLNVSKKGIKVENTFVPLFSL
jgi:CRISPR-associated protein Cas5t